MRFLQIEWHSHERARNAWDIERAEMKAKIAKLEGENKQAKRMTEQLDRQVRMMETALRNERAKSKGGKVESAKEGKSSPAAKDRQLNGVKGAKRMYMGHAIADIHGGNADVMSEAAVIPHNSFLETEEVPETSEKDREQYLDNTTKYLKNCMKEIQYLLTPPAHPPPAQGLPNGNYTGLPDPPLSVEEFYARHHQQQRSQPAGQSLPRATGMPNHQPPPVPDSLPQISVQQDALNARGSRYQEDSGLSEPAMEQFQPNAQQQPTPYDEPAENIAHTYDARGRPVSDQEARGNARQAKKQIDPDGWTFDDEPQSHVENPPPDLPPPRRPDTDLFPSAGNPAQLAAKSPPRTAPGSHRRKSSGSQAMSRRRSSQGKVETHDGADAAGKEDPTQFKVKFALRGHLDAVRSVIFSGGGSPSEPEVCTAGDDGTIKRWIIPASYQSFNATQSSPDLDVQAMFTHRGHEGVVTSLAACPASTGFNTGGRASGDGWIFSGGQDATVRVWERGRVDPKETLIGHTDAVWSVCVLPTTVGTIFGIQSQNYGGGERLLLVSGSADGTVKVWAVSPPPQNASPSTGSRRGVGGSRRHSVTSGSNFPSSPQPSVASNTPFGYTLVHSIERPGPPENRASPTCIAPLSATGDNFVVSYTDSSVLVFDTRTGEEMIGMASNETYDGTMGTSINTVVATSLGMEGANSGLLDASRGLEPEEMGAGATGSREGIEGVVITGHEDRFVRFFDANSGTCHPLPLPPSLPLTSCLFRSMHLHHARAPLRHLSPLSVQRWP
jgi:striatin 1/3/4